MHFSSAACRPQWLPPLRNYGVHVGGGKVFRGISGGPPHDWQVTDVDGISLPPKREPALLMVPLGASGTPSTTHRQDDALLNCVHKPAIGTKTIFFFEICLWVSETVKQMRCDSCSLVFVVILNRFLCFFVMCKVIWCVNCFAFWGNCLHLQKVWIVYLWVHLLRS